MDVESFSAEIAPILKKHGFRKQRLNWRKNLGSAIAVLNVQMSSWGERNYYVNVGIYLKTLGDESSPTYNRCHVQQRLAADLPLSVVNEAIEWFSSRASIEALAKLHRSGQLQGKGLVFKEVISAIAAS